VDALNRNPADAFVGLSIGGLNGSLGFDPGNEVASTNLS
jgi:hypothetical protein